MEYNHQIWSRPRTVAKKYQHFAVGESAGNLQTVHRPQKVYEH